MAQYAVRVFARMADGSVRQAKRYAGNPKWSWEWNGIAADQYNGDVVIDVGTEANLPTNAEEFLAIMQPQAGG